MMEVIRASCAGACYGVERALKLVWQAIGDEQQCASAARPVFTLGPLIHNPQVVAELEDSGVHAVSSLDEIEQGILVIRSHGVPPLLIEQAKSKGLSVIDATCPHVSKVQQAAQDLHEQGYTVLIVGEVGHPEVEGIFAYAGEDALAVRTVDELPDKLPSEQIGVVVQTTKSQTTLAALVEELRRRGLDPLVKNTICLSTKQRQRAAEELAKRVDAMVVIGGKNSSNTTRLYEICRESCPQTFHVESAAELDPLWFIGVSNVGVTAGASTPEEQITAVISKLESYN